MKPSPAKPVSGIRSKPSASPPIANPLSVKRAPQTKMAVGTEFEPGVLVSWCEGRDCRVAQAAKPRRFLPGQDNGVLMFQASAAPKSARAEVRALTGKLVQTGLMLPGTTMAFKARAGRGKYLVTMLAKWPSGEGKWIFGLQGPSGK